MEHRLTKPTHPRTNGEAERMNRPTKLATVQRCHFQTPDELNERQQAFLLAYNHAKWLKTLRGLTPHKFVGAQWHKNPVIFIRDPTHLTMELCPQPTYPPQIFHPIPWLLFLNLSSYAASP